MMQENLPPLHIGSTPHIAHGTCIADLVAIGGGGLERIGGGLLRLDLGLLRGVVLAGGNFPFG